MRLASVIGFLLFAVTIHAQDLPLSQEVHKMNDLANANGILILPVVGEQTSPETTIPNELVSGGYAQPLPEKPQPIAHEGQWIATGEQLPLFRDDLVITERKEDGQLMWHVERVDSCTWCGKPMTWKQAAFDKKAISLWGLRIAMDVADIEITHHSPCFLARTCREANPLLGQTRVQAYAVASALTAIDWFAMAYARKGSKTYHVGGYRHWYIVPVIGQASSAVGIIANLARWNHK